MRNLETPQALKNELFDAFLYLIDGDEFNSSFKYHGRQYSLKTTLDNEVLLQQNFSGGGLWNILVDPDTCRPVIKSLKFGRFDMDDVLNNLDKFVNLLTPEL